MPGFKNNPAVTVTVRPDGTYYVEKAKTEAKETQIRRVPALPAHRGQPVSPIAAAITTSLRDLAGIALAARTVAPSLGKYGVVAAIGLGVLNAWAERQPPPVPRIQLRRIRRTPR